jgi:3-oxoadipate enol-lactonase
MQFANINGHTVHYKHIKNPALNADDKTFLFINSLGTDFRIWDDVVSILKDYGHILLFDKRGHGLSNTVENTNGLNDFADDAIGLLEYLKVQKCIPVGLSVGGMIAQLLANRIAVKIEKLVLCDTRHKIGNAQIWNDRIKAIEEDGLNSITDGVMQRWFPEAFRKQHAVAVDGYKNMLVRTSAIGYIKTCEAIRDADLTEYAKQIKQPVICIVGSKDKSTLPEEVKNLADLIKGSGYEVIEGSGHIPCVDNPVALSKLIIDFIKQ